MSQRIHQSGETSLRQPLVCTAERARQSDDAGPLARVAGLEKWREIADAGRTGCLRRVTSRKRQCDELPDSGELWFLRSMSNHVTVSEKTLAILRCPNDRSQLHEADAALVSRINAAIAGRLLKDRSGNVIDRHIGGGLIREAGDLLYPIVDEIPVMLYEEAIPLAQLAAD
jgi:uncharacterized protein